MGFSRQEYCSGLPFPSPGDLSDPGIEPTSLMSLALAGRFFTSSTTWEAPEITKSTDGDIRLQHTQVIEKKGRQNPE